MKDIVETATLRMNKMVLAILMLLLVASVFFLNEIYNQDKQASIETFPPVGEYMVGLYGHSLDLTDDGGFIVAGYVKYLSREINDHDMWILKADRDGMEEWCKTFGGASTDRVWSVKQTRDKGFLVAGESHSFGDNFQTILLKLDKRGNQSWYKLLGENDSGQGKDIYLTAEGNALITGKTSSDSLKRANYLLCEVTLDGQVTFQDAYEHELPGGAASLSRLTNGDIVLLGNLQDGTTHAMDFGLIRLNQRREVIYKSRFGSEQSDEAKSIVATSDGGYLVCGTEFKDRSNKQDLVVYKFDKSDKMEWKSFAGGLAADGGEQILVTADGGYAALGYTNSSGAGYRDVYVVKLTTTGQVEWTRTFGGKSTDWGYDFQETEDQGFLISAGSKSTGQNATDIWIIKLDKMGEKEWDKVYCTSGKPSDS